jgi:hypothetical protein
MTIRNWEAVTREDWDRQAVKTRLVRRLEKLGYEVKLEPTSPAA